MSLSEIGFKSDDDRFISQAFSPEGGRLLRTQLSRARLKSLIFSYLFVFLGGAALFFGARQQAVFCFLGALMFFINSLKADSDLKVAMAAEKILMSHSLQGSVDGQDSRKK